MEDKFTRLEELIGKDNLNQLAKKTIMIIGLGGVGSYAVEGLVRSNITKFIIVDNDVVSPSNINRQIIATEKTIGLKKVNVICNRIKEINNQAQVIKIDKFIDENNIDELFKYHIDYLIDACDTFNTKCLLIDRCLKNNVKFISSMGTANKFNPSLLEITDIRKTINDPLARKLRKYVKDQNIKSKITVLSSKEVPIKTKDNVLGSTAFVPSSAGLLIGNYIVQDLIKEEMI